MKIQSKESNGEVIKAESVEGRVAEIIEKHGTAMLENMIDSQILHHPASSAFKAEATKGNDKVGYDRLPTEPTASRIGWYDEEQDCYRVNWEYVPGVSVAQAAKAEQFEALKAKFIERIEELTGEEATASQVKSAEADAREIVYGSK